MYDFVITVSTSLRRCCFNKGSKYSNRDSIDNCLSIKYLLMMTTVAINIL